MGKTYVGPALATARPNHPPRSRGFTARGLVAGHHGLLHPQNVHADGTQLVDVGESENVAVLVDDPRRLAGEQVSLPDSLWPEWAHAPATQCTRSTIIGPTVRNSEVYAVQ
eukprot:2621482-Prymnesium_polylepis.1